MACGIGIQAMAEKFAPKLVMPAVNTNMLGMPQEHAVWLERCVACGECRIGATGGICPVVRCAKSLMNGPCGGSHDGLCEVTGLTRRRSSAPGHSSGSASRPRTANELMFEGSAAEGLEQEPAPAAPARWCGRRRSRYDRDDETKPAATSEKILRSGNFAVTGELGPPRAPTSPSLSKRPSI